MRFKLATYRRFRRRTLDMDEPENFAFVARAFWRTLLALVVVLGVLSIAYGFSLLQKVFTLSDVSNAAAQRSVRSNPDRVGLDATVAGFAAREDRYDQLKAQPIIAPDPSI